MVPFRENWQALQGPSWHRAEKFRFSCHKAISLTAANAQEVIDDVFPVQRDAIGQTMTTGQAVDVGRPIAYFGFQIAGH